MGEGGRERKEKGWEKKKGQEKKKVKKKRGGGMRQAPNSVSLPSHPRTGASVSMHRIVGNVGAARQFWESIQLIDFVQKHPHLPRGS
jgi:hypothetical protein